MEGRRVQAARPPDNAVLRGAVGRADALADGAVIGKAVVPTGAASWSMTGEPGSRLPGMAPRCADLPAAWEANPAQPRHRRNRGSRLSARSGPTPRHPPAGATFWCRDLDCLHAAAVSRSSTIPRPFNSPCARRSFYRGSPAGELGVSGMVMPLAVLQEERRRHARSRNAWWRRW